MHELVDILLVEDNDADILLVREALKDAKVANVLHVVQDGVTALDFLLNRNGANPGNVRPGLVLLDLYMPRMNGMEVLKVIKENDTLKSIPVVVMTSSQEERDITKAYALQANSYVIKPMDFDQLITVIETIEDFWLSVVRLPKQ